MLGILSDFGSYFQQFITRISPCRPGASLLKPADVTIPGRAGSEREIAPGSDRRFGARVEPPFDLRMAVRKRDATSPTVIAGGYINQLKAAGVPRVETRHIHDEKAVIDPVLAFVGDHPDAGGARKGHVRDFPHDFVLSLSIPGRVRIQPTVH